jgi:CheY-like chemotaxis protein
MTSTQDGTFEILLVEDNDDDIAIAQRALAKSGLASQLRVAKDGQDALDSLLGRGRYAEGSEDARRLPNVILLDLGLPVISGLDVLRRVKANPALRHVPVVVLTGSAEEALVRLAMELGTNMYLVKPMTLPDAMNIVVGLQRRSAALDELERGAA